MCIVFYENILSLYPAEICTMNVHSLVHLSQSVKNFGPLWAYSSFGFESMNGHLKKHFHGSRFVLPQLIRNLEFHQSMLDREYRAKNHADGMRGEIPFRMETMTLLVTYLLHLCDTNTEEYCFECLKMIKKEVVQSVSLFRKREYYVLGLFRVFVYVMRHL